MKEWSAVIVAVVAIIGAAIGAAISSWLGGRQAVSQDIRGHRLTTYPSAWSRTSVVSRWPRTTARFDNLRDLHGDLRTWYYTIGGLYLSENARTRYGHLQELLSRVIDRDDASAESDAAAAYDDVMEAASAFRSALTEDLSSRQQRSVLAAVGRRRAHRREDAHAEVRLSRHPANPRQATRIDVTPAEEALWAPATPSAGSTAAAAGPPRTP